MIRRRLRNANDGGRRIARIAALTCALPLLSGAMGCVVHHIERFPVAPERKPEKVDIGPYSAAIKYARGKTGIGAVEIKARLTYDLDTAVVRLDVSMTASQFQKCTIEGTAHELDLIVGALIFEQFGQAGQDREMGLVQQKTNHALVGLANYIIKNDKVLGRFIVESPQCESEPKRREEVKPPPTEGYNTAMGRTGKGRMEATKPVLRAGMKKGYVMLQRLDDKADSLKGTAADSDAAEAEEQKKILKSLMRGLPYHYGETEVRTGYGSWY